MVYQPLEHFPTCPDLPSKYDSMAPEVVRTFGAPTNTISCPTHCVRGCFFYFWEFPALSLPYIYLNSLFIGIQRGTPAFAFPKPRRPLKTESTIKITYVGDLSFPLVPKSTNLYAMLLPDHQSTRVMKDEHGTRLLFSTSAGIRCRRMYTAMAILAATAYAFGVITSPLLSFLSCKQDALSSVTATMPTALRQPSTDGNSHDQIAPNLFADLTRYQPECAEAVPSKHVRQTILDNLFNGTSPFEDFPPHHARDLLRQQRIKGWGSNGPVFQILLNEVKPRVVVELGTFLGASAIHMAILARELRLKTQIFCVDDFRGWPGFRQKFHDIKMINGDVMLLYQFMQNVQYMNLTDSVVPLPFSTVSALRKMCEWGIYADLIEVDAAHDFNSAWADINAAFAILRPGGVIFGHDYFTKMDNRGVRRAVDLFAKIKGFRVQPHGQHWILRAA